MRWLTLVALMLLARAAVVPAHADMYQDGSNAKLPEARANLGGLAVCVDSAGALYKKAACP